MEEEQLRASRMKYENNSSQDEHNVKGEEDDDVVVDDSDDSVNNNLKNDIDADGMYAFCCCNCK